MRTKSRSDVLGTARAARPGAAPSPSTSLPNRECNGEMLRTASNWRTSLRSRDRGRAPPRALKPQLGVERRLPLAQLEVQVRALEGSAVAHRPDDVPAAHFVP